ncbi:MAG: hypothetical protein OXD44_00460 [Gammaproteobacteria bacterium]|nr:hypothetical protein [Gammaproteobacteria bacterium]
MTTSNIVLLGGPDTGKTNFIARLWAAIRNDESTLRLSEIPNEIKYVEEQINHLNQGHFAPRTDKNVVTEQCSITIPLASPKAVQGKSRLELVIPDVSGEIWKSAVETREIDRERMRQLEEATGAIVFVRVLSDQNVSPPDWVNLANLMHLQEGADLGQIPTQVMLCEFVRFLELRLSVARQIYRPRVAVVVTAWDLLDAKLRETNPRNYLEQEYPLFAGRLADVSHRFEVEIFSMSILGGDLKSDEEFRDKLLDDGLRNKGYVRFKRGEEIQESPDLGIPIAWAIHQDTIY